MNTTHAPTALDTIDDGFAFLHAALLRLDREQPATLLLFTGLIFVIPALLMTPVCILIVYYCVRARVQSQLAKNKYAELEARSVEHPISLDDSDSDSEEEDVAQKPRPLPPALPRLEFPAPPPLGADMHMTPRTRAAILGNWTPRKR